MVKARRRYTRRRKTRRKYLRKQKGGSAIPKVCIQTSKEAIPEYVTKQLKDKMTGWDYRHFLDADILDFFAKNPIDEFKEVADKFASFSSGEHKSDLFRYYYLYLNGGVFIDSDLTLQVQLDNIIGTNTFVSVKALEPAGSIFNGFLAVIPKHPIIYEALKGLYSMNNDVLQKDYSVVCKRLGEIVAAYKGGGVKLLYETENLHTHCPINDPDTKALAMIHYQNSEIPRL
jgi:mannosyltransferase OCH1-like enzyme